MDEITETGRSKADFVADVLNKTLYTLITTCSKADGVRNYFDVGVIAYGGTEVVSGFGGALSDGIVHPISAISENTLRVEERQKKVDAGAGGPREDQGDSGELVRSSPRFLPADRSSRDRRSIDRRHARGNGRRAAADCDQRRPGAGVHPARNHPGRAGNPVSDLRNRSQRRVLAIAAADVQSVAATSCPVRRRQGLCDRRRIAWLHLQRRSPVHSGFL